MHLLETHQSTSLSLVLCDSGRMFPPPLPSLVGPGGTHWKIPPSQSRHGPHHPGSRASHSVDQGGIFTCLWQGIHGGLKMWCPPFLLLGNFCCVLPPVSGCIECAGDEKWTQTTTSTPRSLLDGKSPCCIYRRVETRSCGGSRPQMFVAAGTEFSFVHFSSWGALRTQRMNVPRLFYRSGRCSWCQCCSA